MGYKWTFTQTGKKSIQRANGKVRICTRIQFSSCYDPLLEKGRNE